MTTRKKTSALLAEFKTRLKTIYGERLKGVFLYGSHARDQGGPESDVDILIVLDDWEHYAGEIDRTGAVASELSLAYGVSISQCLFASAIGCTKTHLSSLTPARMLLPGEGDH